MQNVLAGAGFFASAKVLSAQEMQMSGDMPGMNMKDKKGSIHEHGSLARMAMSRSSISSPSR